MLHPHELQSVLEQCPSIPGTKVVVGMSGGVDSSLTAAILTELGTLEVSGCWMRNWDLQEESPTIIPSCTQDQEFEDASFVAKTLGIKLVEKNFSRDYWCSVWEPSLQCYQQGRTPNPDTLCNRYIKYGCFLDSLTCDRFATGHYARLSNDFNLIKAADPNKDQTYFLGTVLPSRLKKACFPIGGLTKDRVKALALAAGFTKIAMKNESQGVCFIGERGKFGNFLSEYIDNPKGRFKLRTFNKAVAHSYRET